MGASATGNTEGAFVIRSVSDLDEVLRGRGQANRRYTVEVAGLSNDRRTAAEADLQRLANACGCTLASVLLLLSAVSYAAAVAMGPDPAVSKVVLGRGLILVMAIGVAGKLVGIAYARIRFGLLVRRLRCELTRCAAPDHRRQE